MNQQLFLLEVAPTTLRALVTKFTKARGTNTITTGVANPPWPTLVIAITTTLTRYPHNLIGFML
jgi:hypothetical protein